MKKVSKKQEVFREGESDEYNSEVDGQEMDFDTPELNFDITGIRSSKIDYHKQLLGLATKFGNLPEDFEE